MSEQYAEQDELSVPTTEDDAAEATDQVDDADDAEVTDEATDEAPFAEAVAAGAVVDGAAVADDAEPTV